MHDILIGWKEIALYLRVSEKTAMRYYKKRKLPVLKNHAGHPAIRREAAELWLLKG